MHVQCFFPGRELKHSLVRGRDLVKELKTLKRRFAPLPGEDNLWASDALDILFDEKCATDIAACPLKTLIDSFWLPESSPVKDRSCVEPPQALAHKSPYRQLGLLRAPGSWLP